MPNLVEIRWNTWLSTRNRELTDIHVYWTEFYCRMFTGTVPGAAITLCYAAIRPIVTRDQHSLLSKAPTRWDALGYNWAICTWRMNVRMDSASHALNYKVHYEASSFIMLSRGEDTVTPSGDFISTSDGKKVLLSYLTKRLFCYFRNHTNAEVLTHASSTAKVREKQSYRRHRVPKNNKIDAFNRFCKAQTRDRQTN